MLQGSGDAIGGLQSTEASAHPSGTQIPSRVPPRAGRLRRVSGGCEGVQSARHTQTESATFLCMPQQLYMWRGSEAARRNHDEQGDCAMHRAERDGEYPRTIGERKRSSRPVNRRNGSEGSVRSSPCRHATSRLTVQACHRSNAVRDRVEYHVGDFSCRT